MHVVDCRLSDIRNRAGIARIYRWLPVVRSDLAIVVFLSAVSGIEAEAGGDAFAAKAHGWEALLTQIRAALAARAEGKQQAE